MSNLKQSRVGKPSAKRVLGEGYSAVINMPDVGQIHHIANNVPRNSISRCMGQAKPHMKVSVDKPEGGGWNRKP